MTTLFKFCNGLQSIRNLLHPSLDILTIPNRGAKSKLNYPRQRFPPWFIKQNRVLHEENLTKENKEFVQEYIKDKYPQPDIFGNPSPLKIPVIEPNLKWEPRYRRVGVIARKLGVVPMWTKKGEKVLTTMFQVSDNHIIKYIPPEEFEPKITKRKGINTRKYGCLLVGANSCDPQLFTKEYCGLFNDAGVMPKQRLGRFIVSPQSALQPGTPLYATHFQVGQFVDIRGKTMDRGFQGVMKRWGFAGMPASHGVTKTHRRPGNIGSGGKKARVMPGTKMPGHMGNRYRTLRGQEIIRINTKFNVLWVKGQATAGETNSLVQIYDTILPLKSLKACNQTPAFPTYFPNGENPLPEELYVDYIHNFNDPTIMFKEDE